MEIKYRIELPKLMKHLNLPMVAIEIGVAEGNSSVDFLNAGLDKLYSIDNWKTIEGQKGDGGHNQKWHDANFEQAVSRLSSFGDKSVILRGMSNEMAKFIPDNSVGLVYIDGWHDFSGVWADTNNYWSKLVVGGIMAYHDYEMDHIYGVKKAVQKFAKENNLTVHLLPENKKEDAGAFLIKK